MPLAPFDFLAAIIATRGSSYLGCLDRLAIDTRRARGGLTPGCYARLLAQRLDNLGPCAVVAPLGKVVIHGTLGQQIMGQQPPLAATPIQIENRASFKTGKK